MKLSKKSIEWAFAHLLKENDTDLFPEPLEIEIMHCKRDDIIARLQNLDIGAYEWKPFRRFLVPKGELSYRMITQLNPLDSYLLLSMSLVQKLRKNEFQRVKSVYSVIDLLQMKMAHYTVEQTAGRIFGKPTWKMLETAVALLVWIYLISIIRYITTPWKI